MSKYVLILSYLYLLFLAACSPVSPEPDLGRLFQSSCDAPCWYEVVPGKTTKSELEKLISALPYYNSEKISWEESIYHSNLYMDVADGWAGIEIHLVGNIVQHIQIYSQWGPRGLRNLGFLLADVLSLYGEPEQVIVSRGCGGDSYCINLNLVYRAKGVIVSVESHDEPSNLRLLPSLPVRKVLLVNPPTVSEALRDYIELLSDPCDFEASTFQWSGYTTLQMNSLCR